MRKTLVRGHSDDCIDLEGGIQEEFNPGYKEWVFLHFDEGTVVRVGYDVVEEKGWCIEIVKQGAARTTFLSPELDGGAHYTDRLELSGVMSVECWGSLDGPTDEDMESWWDEQFDTRDYPLRKLIAAYRALKG